MGCEYSFDLIDGADSTMNFSFFPTIDTLEANGTLFIEITPSYEGYYAQLPVTLPVTEYSSQVHRMVSAWNKADKAAREILRPGTKVSDLCKILINTVRENGFISPYRPGHSIGLDALDFWSITEDSDKILRPGMVLAVHPSVMKEVGGDACGMGYTYIITGDADKLSKIDLAEELIGE
jgi:Xaa-Pro aminopeptidase